LSAGAQLPRWVQEEVNRSTRKERRQAVLQYLEAAAEAFADAKYGKAAQRAEQAKKASSSNATIREILGLSYYRLGRWKDALKELRGFRRIAGETTHMPVEMDCLRALERSHDVEKVWAQLHDLGGRRDTMREGRVVYGSYLLDAGRLDEAWKVINPKKIHKEADESSLRQWYVAARVAARLGDNSSARQLVSAITTADPGFPGLDQLEQEIAAS
jgi:predicted Zn-dependent protease